MGTKIGFIGTGNMGSALLRATLKTTDKNNIYISNKPEEVAEKLSKELGVNLSLNEKIAKNCDYIFLGVKPQMMGNMLSEICEILAERENPPVLISMAAGISTEKIAEMAKGDYPVIRIMPNTPVMVGKGMILVSKNDLVEDGEIAFFKKFMNGAGELDEIPESLIDAGCAVSGCGPAFLYMFAESMAEGGVLSGLPMDKALKYAVQTIIGSATMLKETNEHPSKLKQNVMSPGGSTVEGVKALEKGNFRATVIDAVSKSYARTKELGK